MKIPLTYLEQKRGNVRRGAEASERLRDERESDLELRLALGDPHDLSAYQDCIQGARREGATRVHAS